jgi:cobalt-precorrin 5A hydrolase
MKDTVVIALPRFLRDAERIAAFVGADVKEYSPHIFSEEFLCRRRIIALMSMGIVVRKIAPLLSDKWNDPAIVVVGPDLAYAIPLIGGHHGANDLAKELAPLGIRPVITTATEATGRDSVESVAQRTGSDILNRDSTRQVNASMLGSDVPVHAVSGPGIVIAGPDVAVLLRKGTYTVGLGCRKGVKAEEVLDALQKAFERSQIQKGDVIIYATTVRKAGETGLIKAVSVLSGNLIFLDDDTINAQAQISPSRASKIGLNAVAEPCALAVAKKKELIMRKTVFGRVTVAIAR